MSYEPPFTVTTKAVFFITSSSLFIPSKTETAEGDAYGKP